jgi:hypothetical protein
MYIATEDAKERRPIQVRAEILRHGAAPAPYCAWQGFAMMTDDAAAASSEGLGHKAACWRDADLKRAIAIAEESGLRSYRVEIGPDGTISIIVGEPARATESPPTEI